MQPPKTVLTALAARGTSATRAEALRCSPQKSKTIGQIAPRNTRAALLRRLYCDRKKSAGARLAALRELLCIVKDEPQAAEVERLSVGFHNRHSEHQARFSRATTPGNTPHHTKSSR